MTMLLNNTQKKRHDMNVDGHDTPLIPVYISLAECIKIMVQQIR